MKPAIPLYPYLGSFGYDQASFWQFNDEKELWQVFEQHTMPHRALLWGSDTNGYVVFHLLLLSETPIFEQRYQVFEEAVTWLNTQGQTLDLTNLRLAGFERDVLV